MHIVRLQSGLIESAKLEGETPKSLDRRAMLVYSGKFDSMDGPVTVSDEHLEKLAANHNGLLSKVARMATGEVPLKNYPPIQLDHSTSAKDTVGRLVGNVELGEFETPDGEKVKALYGTVRVLGQENVEKVVDGRWTHLSIGADLETGKLQELTITPFPAAEGASLMSKVRHFKAAEYKQRFQSAASKIDNSSSIFHSDDSSSALFTDKYKAHQFALIIESDDFFKSVKMYRNKSGNKYEVEAQWSSVDGYRLKYSLQDVVKEESYKGWKIQVVRAHPGKVTSDLFFEAVSSDGKKIQSKDTFSKVEDALAEAKRQVDLTQLSSKKLPSEGKMLERLKSFFTKYMKLSEAEADKKLAEMPDEAKAKMAAEAEKHEKMKKHLVEHEKLSEEDAEKKLAAMDDEAKKKLAGEMEEKEKLAAKESDEAKAKMTAARESITKLSADFRKATDSVSLSMKKAAISTRLSKLRADARITPAEMKKLDIDKLAKESDATVDAVLKSYQDREPVIMTGVVGSRKGVALSDVHKSKRTSQLMSDTLAAMPFTGQAWKRLQEGKEEEGAPDTVNIHVDTDPHTDLAAHKLADDMYTQACKMIDEGKGPEAKEHLKKLMEHCKKHMRRMADEPVADAADSQAQMAALADSVKCMQTEFDKLTQLAGTLAGA